MTNPDTDLVQARADLAALHAEAARLRAALDLAERDKAHALVDELMQDAVRVVANDAIELLLHLGAWGLHDGRRKELHAMALNLRDRLAALSPPQSDDRGEVAGTDTVEAQEGTRRVWRHGGCGYETTTPIPVPCPRCGHDAEWITAMNTAGPTPTIVATTMGAPLVVKHVV